MLYSRSFLVIYFVYSSLYVFVRIFNENLHGTVGSVCEGGVPIRASSGWHTEAARKPDELAGCMHDA